MLITEVTLLPLRMLSEKVRRVGCIVNELVSKKKYFNIFENFLTSHD